MNNNEFFKQLLVLTESEDYRELFGKINGWALVVDFTYRDTISNDRKLFFRAFVISQLYDLEQDRRAGVVRDDHIEL